MVLSCGRRKGDDTAHASAAGFIDEQRFQQTARPIPCAQLPVVAPDRLIPAEHPVSAAEHNQCGTRIDSCGDRRPGFLVEATGIAVASGKKARLVDMRTGLQRGAGVEQRIWPVSPRDHRALTAHGLCLGARDDQQGPARIDLGEDIHRQFHCPTRRQSTLTGRHRSSRAIGLRPTPSTPVAAKNADRKNGNGENPGTRITITEVAHGPCHTGEPLAGSAEVVKLGGQNIWVPHPSWRNAWPIHPVCQPVATSYTQGLNTNHCPATLSGRRAGAPCCRPGPSARVVMRHPPGPSPHSRPCPRRRARQELGLGGCGGAADEVEPAGLLAGQRGVAVLDQGVQGVGDRPGGVAGHLVDLVRGEAAAGVGTQVGQDLLAQAARPSGRGLLPPGGSPGRPTGLGGLLVDLVQAGPHGVQVPAAGQSGGGGAGGGLDLPDVPGDVRHEGRVRRSAGAGAAAGGRVGLVLRPAVLTPRRPSCHRRHPPLTNRSGLAFTRHPSRVPGITLSETTVTGTPRK